MLVEVTTFRLRADVDEADARAADHEVQVGFAHHQPGLLRRTTAVADDGEWLVVTLWHAEADALAAEAAGGDDPLVSALRALLDGPPVVRRYQDVGG